LTMRLRAERYLNPEGGVSIFWIIFLI
jgi:hypothetical protein